MTAEGKGPPTRRSSWAHSRLLVAALFLASLGAGIAQFPRGAFGSGFESVALARNLAEHGEFANPFRFPTGPSAHLAPLFPAFLALLIRLCGYSPAFVAVGSACVILAQAMHTALLPAASDMLFADRRPGVCAAMFAIPPGIYPYIPVWESMYCATGVLLFCLFAQRQVRRGSVWGLFLTGVAIGLLALLNPVTILVAVPWLGFLLWQAAPGGRTRACLLAAAGTLLALLPWTVRNHQQLHAWFFVRDNLGIELYVSNNDAAQPTIYANKTNAILSLHPSYSEREAVALRYLGEVRYNRLCLAVARGWIRSHSERFAALTLARFRLFWFPDPAIGVWQARAVSWITSASALGLILLALRRRPAAVFVAIVLALFPLVYYVVQMDARYRAPILWLSLLLAGYLVVAACDAAMSWWRSRTDT